LVKDGIVLAHAAHFDLSLVLSDHFLIGGHQFLLVGRMHRPLPFHANHFLRLVTTKSGIGLVNREVTTFRMDAGDTFGGVFQRYGLLLQGLLRLLALGNFLLQGPVGFFQGCFAAEVHKHAHLGSENGWVNGLGQVVHGTSRVALDDVFVFGVMGREENDRNVLGFLAFFDELSQLITVHSGHFDVQDEERKIPTEERHQCLAPRLNCRKIIVRGIQDAFQGHQVPRLVINQQNVDGRFHGHTIIVSSTQRSAVQR
jgi:hypothetical protein